MKEKLLIVEDQFIEANNLQEMLETAGYFVTGIARSVPKALELIARNKPDIVLLDIFVKGPRTGIDLPSNFAKKIFRLCTSRPTRIRTPLMRRRQHGPVAFL